MRGALFNPSDTNTIPVARRVSSRVADLWEMN
jgi:hypothetical protein